MKKRMSTKPLTNKDFDLIKTLQKANVPNKKVMDIATRSNYTTAMIGLCDTWQDYIDLRAERYAMKKVINVPMKKEAETPLYTTDTDAPQPRPPQTVALSSGEYALFRIADAMERLADAWESEPKKNGFLRR